MSLSVISRLFVLLVIAELLTPMVANLGIKTEKKLQRSEGLCYRINWDWISNTPNNQSTTILLSGLKYNHNRFGWVYVPGIVPTWNKNF